MRFAGYSFWFLSVVMMAVAGFYVWAFRSRRRACERFAEKGLLGSLLPAGLFKARRMKAIVLSAGIFFSLIALMRPQWGFTWRQNAYRGLDILVALDTSKSMMASDIKPSRLERAKLAIRDFAGKLKGDRIGLIAFAGSAFLECPLTVDYGGFLLSLGPVDVNTIPRGGTSISSAIKEALRSYPSGQKKYKVLIIITDGEDHEGDPVRLAQEAAKEGIVVFCIGIGTPEGELVFAEQENGNKEYIKDNEGNVVKSRLNEEVLQKIALATGGAYVRSSNTDFGLDLLYTEKISAMEKREYEGRLSKWYEERFQIPLLIGLLLLLCESFVSEPNAQIRRSR